MKSTSEKRPSERERPLDIEWIIAREIEPMQDELVRLRAFVEALAEAIKP